MLYIIGLTRKGYSKNGEILRYKVLDTLSESQMLLTPIQLQKILSTGNLEVANAKLSNNTIVIADWVNNITVKLTGGAEEFTGGTEKESSLVLLAGEEHMRTGNKDNALVVEKGCSLILLAKEEEKYKLVNRTGYIIRVTLDKLDSYIKCNEVANCNITSTDNKINSLDTYEITKNEDFEKTIATKYKAFEAKALLLGHGQVSFNYEIENEQVKLKRYTGKSKNIILPSFITAIMKHAFVSTNIETIEMNEGLKIIGEWALSPTSENSSLKSVEVPSTVELISAEAFTNNIKLFTNKGTLDPNRLKLRSEKTIILR